VSADHSAGLPFRAPFGSAATTSSEVPERKAQPGSSAPAGGSALGGTPQPRVYLRDPPVEPLLAAVGTRAVVRKGLEVRQRPIRVGYLLMPGERVGDGGGEVVIPRALAHERRVTQSTRLIQIALGRFNLLLRLGATLSGKIGELRGSCPRQGCAGTDHCGTRNWSVRTSAQDEERARGKDDHDHKDERPVAHPKKIAFWPGRLLHNTEGNVVSPDVRAVSCRQHGAASAVERKESSRNLGTNGRLPSPVGLRHDPEPGAGRNAHGCNDAHGNTQHR
jgi:hypothetical protein